VRQSGIERSLLRFGFSMIEEEEGSEGEVVLEGE
jgi:hypothetical protein